MKKKVLYSVLAMLSVGTLAVSMSGCGVTDKIKEKIDQARCEHEWNEGEETKAASCTETGEWTKTCNVCGKTETEDIEKLSHVAVYVEEVAPTCSENGISDGTICHDCGTVLSGLEEVPALGHTVVVLEGHEATCETAGVTDGKVCTRCDETIVPQELIEKVACVDEDNDGICDVCDNNIFDEATYKAVTVGEKINANYWYRVKTSEVSLMKFAPLSFKNDSDAYKMTDAGYLSGFEVVRRIPDQDNPDESVYCIRFYGINGKVVEDGLSIGIEVQCGKFRALELGNYIYFFVDESVKLSNWIGGEVDGTYVDGTIDYTVYGPYIVTVGSVEQVIL